jgi:hypothetical protein
VFIRNSREIAKLNRLRDVFRCFEHHTVGLAANEDVLCLPLLVDQQVVGMLLGVDPLKGQAGDRLADYDTLTKKLSYAFQILLLRRRILGQ